MTVSRACEAALDAVVVLLSSWTMTYHVCLVADLSVVVSVWIELLMLGLVAILWWGRPRAARRSGSNVGRSTTPTPVAFSKTVAGAVLLAVVAALGMALDLPWIFVWVPFLASAALAVIGAARELPSRGPYSSVEDSRTADAHPSSGTPAGRRSSRVALLAVGWGLALAALSSVVLRVNPDDLFYVNLSQWVAENGTFPLRDTIFSDLVYPMANWPPMASYDGLVGVVAHLLHARAGTVAYVVITPLATFFAVLALWRLLRAWRVPHLAFALSGALVFLLFDGATGYGSPGNLFLTRLWQGKVIFLCVLVPLLLVHALAYVENPSRRGLVRLFLGGVAAVALSTTALFLTPLLAVAGAAPLLLRRRWRTGAAGLVAMAAYPLAGAAVTVALGGRSADDFGARRLYRFEPEWFGHQIFLSGLLALLAVLAVLVGCLLLRDRAARVTTSVLVLATAVTFVPGVTDLGYATVGLGPTLWRISWGCTVAALVGVVAGEIMARLRRRPIQVVAGVVATGLLVGLGTPIWAASTGATFVAPLQWKRGEETRSVTEWLVATTQTGDVVLAPNALSITVAVTTTDIKTVAPRAYYMDYLRADPSFDFDDRSILVSFANGEASSGDPALTRSLSLLDVVAVCLDAKDIGGSEVLTAAGFSEALQNETYRCLLRDTSLQ